MYWLCIYFGRKSNLGFQINCQERGWQIIAVLRNLWLALPRLPRLMYQIIVSIILYVVVLYYVTCKFICPVMLYILLLHTS